MRMPGAERHDPEFELLDTGVFDEDRYFDVQVEYAKADINDIAIRITVTNRGQSRASLRPSSDALVPQYLVMGGRRSSSRDSRWPRLLLDRRSAAWRRKQVSIATNCIVKASPRRCFTENETNYARLYGSSNRSFAKDGINDAVVNGKTEAVNPANRGSKAVARYKVHLEGGASTSASASSDCRLRSWRNAFQGLRFSLSQADRGSRQIFRNHHPEHAQRRRAKRDAAIAGRSAVVQAVLPLCDQGVAGRRSEATFAATGTPHGPQREVGSSCTTPMFSRCRTNGNIPGLLPGIWPFIASRFPSSMRISPRTSLSLMLREWYMHPNGQLPAYEWAFGDVNPPVHAWAVWRVYRIEERRRGAAISNFSSRLFISFC